MLGSPCPRSEDGQRVRAPDEQVRSSRIDKSPNVINSWTPRGAGRAAGGVSARAPAPKRPPPMGTASSNEVEERRRRGATHEQPHRPGRHEGPEGVEIAVGQVDDVHDAVDEAEPAGDEKEHCRVEERVEDVNQERVHRPIPCPT